MRKLMFNDRYGLTNAVIEGTKTQTRRIIRRSDNIVANYVNPESFPFGDPLAFYEDSRGLCRLVYTDSGKVVTPSFNYGQRIAVAQPYKDVINHILMIGEFQSELAAFAYMKHPGWNNKMFVRAELMPVTLIVKGVKAEFIQDISDDDCLCEGVVKVGGGYGFVDTKSKTGISGPYDTPRDAFEALIRKVSGNSDWEENPLVWAYTFEVERTEDE